MTSAAELRNLGKATTRRYLLLLIVMLASCLALLNTVLVQLLSESFYRRCMLAAGVHPDDPSTPSTHLGLTLNEELAVCRSDALLDVLLVSLAGTVAVGLAAVLLYLLIPLWKGRPGRLLLLWQVSEASTPNPPNPSDIEGRQRDASAVGANTQSGNEHLRGLTEHLARLCARAGLARLPQFAVDPRAITAGAVVFGAIGQYTVCLHGGLVARRTRDPQMFDAVVLHELGHIRNRDVDLAYLSVALWRILLAVVLLPCVTVQVWLLFQGNVLGVDRVYWLGEPPGRGSLIFSGALVAQVYLARTDILRDRELCADVDAASWGANPRFWDPSYRSTRDATGSGVVPAHVMRVLRWFLGAWRAHPAWEKRYKVITKNTMVYNYWAPFLFFVSFGTLIYAATDGGPSSWPSWLMASLLYLFVPLVFATGFAVMPPKNPEIFPLQGTTHPPLFDGAGPRQPATNNSGSLTGPGPMPLSLCVFAVHGVPSAVSGSGR